MLLENDSNIVDVDETPDYLSIEESNLLRQQLEPTDGFSKEVCLCIVLSIFSILMITGICVIMVILSVILEANLSAILM